AVYDVGPWSRLLPASTTSTPTATAITPSTLNPIMVRRRVSGRRRDTGGPGAAAGSAGPEPLPAFSQKPRHSAGFSPHDWTNASDTAHDGRLFPLSAAESVLAAYPERSASWRSVRSAPARSP